METPKRPEATCLMALFLESPFKSFENVLIFSASPELLFPINSVHNRQVFMCVLADGSIRHGTCFEFFTISVQGSTSSIEIGSVVEFK
jgi:hypothetical protein